MNDGTENGCENEEKNAHITITLNYKKYYKKKVELKTLSEPSLSRKTLQRAGACGFLKNRMTQTAALGVRGVAPRQARMLKRAMPGQTLPCPKNLSPREPPFGGRMGEGAPVRARKGVGRGIAPGHATYQTLGHAPKVISPPGGAGGWGVGGG